MTPGMGSGAGQPSRGGPAGDAAAQRALCVGRRRRQGPARRQRPLTTPPVAPRDRPRRRKRRWRRGRQPSAGM
eukprot:9381703-Lingulodinium_polyedra.AAC.1